MKDFNLHTVKMTGLPRTARNLAAVRFAKAKVKCIQKLTSDNRLKKLLFPFANLICYLMQSKFAGLTENQTPDLS